jgi:hypothetical protein
MYFVKQREPAHARSALGMQAAMQYNKSCKKMLSLEIALIILLPIFRFGSRGSGPYSSPKTVTSSEMDQPVTPDHTVS